MGLSPRSVRPGLARLPKLNDFSQLSRTGDLAAIGREQRTFPMGVWPTVCIAIRSTGKIDHHRGLPGTLRVGRTSRANVEDGTELMKRVLRIVKTVGSLLAIEIFVPGGTLIVLALLLTGRSGSPFVGTFAKRIPILSRVLPRLT